MIYRFKCKSDGDVVMLQATAERVLAVIGKDVTPQGILEPGQMAAALQALQAAVATDDAARSGRDDAPAAAGDDAPAPTAGDPVSLRRRVWPLVEMIRRAQAEGEPVLWGV